MKTILSTHIIVFQVSWQNGRVADLRYSISFIWEWEDDNEMLYAMGLHFQLERFPPPAALVPMTTRVGSQRGAYRAIGLFVTGGSCEKCGTTVKVNLLDKSQEAEHL